MSLNSPNINVMVRAAEKAARSLTRDFGEVEQLQVSKKGPADFVSAADRRAEEVIHAELLKMRPDYGFLMEEQGEFSGKDKDRRWIVDPLDGTTNFLHGLPHWAISIALEEKGEMTAALIYDPIKNEMFTAEKGRGAFMGKRRMRVSGRREMAMSLIAGGSPAPNWAGSDIFPEEVQKVLAVSAGFRRYGAASLDLAYVAAGRYEGYWEYALKPWDAAAGVLIVREAGGTVTTVSGDGDPIFSKGLLASNGLIHEELRTLLKKPGQDGKREAKQA